jgi:hypothetical protein
LQTGEGDLPQDSQPDFFSAKAAPVEAMEREERRGPGRPKGSVNKTTAEMIDFIQHTKGDPRLALARIMATPIKDLAAELCCKRLEAAEFWKQCTLGLLPFMAGKPALEVAVRSESTKLVLFAGSPQQPVELPPGGVVGLLEQAAAQARAEGWDTPIGAVIEGEVAEVESDDKSKP